MSVGTTLEQLQLSIQHTADHSSIVHYIIPHIESIFTSVYVINKRLINRFIISVFFPRPPLYNGRIVTMLPCALGENSYATDYDLRQFKRISGENFDFYLSAFGFTLMPVIIKVVLEVCSERKSLKLS